MWKHLINDLPIFSLCLHRHCSSVSLNYLTELLNLEELSISNSGTTSLVCQIHEKDFSKTFLLSCQQDQLGRRQECRRRLFCLRSSSRQTTKTPDSQLRLEPAALSEEAGCSRRERGRGGIFETRHRLRPPREGRNDWGSKFRRPTLPAHPYSGFHTLEPLHTLYLLIPKPLDSTYPSSSRRWPILSIFTSS